MIEKIKDIPKIELHLHLDGSISKELASKLSGLSESELEEKMVASSKCENLSEYLTKFVFPISLMQTKENLYEVAKDLVNRLVKDKVIYAEIRFAPIFHTKEGLTLEEVVDAVLLGLNTNDNIKTNLILCMMRGLPQEDNLKIIELAEKYLNKGICALDLAGAEDKYPLEDYVDLFKIIKEKGISFTIHAGENGSASEVKKAINCGAKRIGHGIHAIDDEEVLTLIKEKNILLEICPTSNVQTNAIKTYQEHPIEKFCRLGIPVSINTDNMTVSNITLSSEYEKLAETFNFELSDFYNINRNAIKHAFLSDEEKRKLLELIDEVKYN